MIMLFLHLVLSFEEGLILILGLSTSRELPGGGWARGAWSRSLLGWWVLVASSGETVLRYAAAEPVDMKLNWIHGLESFACNIFVDNS